MDIDKSLDRATRVFFRPSCTGRLNWSELFLMGQMLGGSKNTIDCYVEQAYTEEDICYSLVNVMYVCFEIDELCCYLALEPCYTAAERFIKFMWKGPGRIKRDAALQSYLGSVMRMTDPNNCDQAIT